MNQTILAFLALMAAGLLSFNQQQATLRSYSEILDDEMEVAASGVAIHVMEMISAKAFDERTTPAQLTTHGAPADESEFSAAHMFGEATPCDLDEPFLDAVGCDDLDDAHMADSLWQSVPFGMRGGVDLPFEVNVAVVYVDDVDLETVLTAGTSNTKRVRVRVRSRMHTQMGRYEQGIVQLDRLYAYNEDKELERAGL